MKLLLAPVIEIVNSENLTILVRENKEMNQYRLTLATL